MQRKSLIKRKIEQPPTADGGADGHDAATETYSHAITLAASRATDLAPMQGLLPDGEDDNFISFGRAASSSSSSALGFSDEDDNENTTGYESDRSEVPEKSDASPVSSPTTRESFSGTIFEQRVATDVREAHLTLLTLPSPLTLQGPCGIYGLGGETSINGYLIGQKRMLLTGKGDRATAAPVKRLGTKTSEATDPLHADTDPETIFGVVNWQWVRERLESWQRRNPVQMSILLVVQHRDTAKKQWFEKSAVDPREVPSFIANYRYLATPPAVLEMLSTIAKQRQAAVAVLGERDVGKSTMCRMLSNALLSQHGKCYWVDLDLGQPEFTVPGCLSVVKLLRPLTTDVISRDDWSLESSYFLGATSIACPVSYANAMKTLCDFVKSNNCFPCVINTHGWVQSTGRRGSLECIRRLRATHIVHMGKTRGADMEWSKGSILGDPTQGLNSSISNGRFWHGTDARGSLPNVEASASPYHCRIHHIETAANGKDSSPNDLAIRSGKRDRDEDQADAHVYRVVADYVTRPKGDNVKRRRAKWFNYFSALWSGCEDNYSEVVFELAKLPFVVLAGADETNAAATNVRLEVLAEVLRDSIVAICTSGGLQPAPGATLLSAFEVTPTTLCFGIVKSQRDGTVTLAIPHNVTFVAEVLGAHKSRLGIAISTDRGDYSGVLQKASARRSMTANGSE